MKKIIAIGGGEIGRPGFPIETTKIDKEIIKLSGKKTPKLLFIPTASSDSKGYVKAVKKHFGERLGCTIKILYLIDKKPTKKEITDKILKSDIVYVGGGNTLQMMKIWKKFGVNNILHKAFKKGIVMSGISAGAICWFKYGHSDSLKFKNRKANYIRVKGLGFINSLYCPHYDVEKTRHKSLKQFVKTSKTIGIAVENCSAIEILDDQYRIITSKNTANAYKIFWRNHRYFKEKIVSEKKFKPLYDILNNS